MRYNIIYIGFAIFVLMAFGCSNFLEEYSQDLEYAASCKDLDEILVQEGYMQMSSIVNATHNPNAYYPFLFVMDDDAEELVACSSWWGLDMPNTYFYYTWAPDPVKAWNDVRLQNTEDNTISRLYKHIATVNTVINYVDEFSSDPQEERMRVRGEGLFLRAAYYLMVNNLYGWAYDAKNKGADMGVPLKTSEWVVADYFGRASVGEVYERIENDLMSACENLRGVTQKSFYKVNEEAARILLSRLYLYMENYDAVIAQCDTVLAMNSCPLSDLRSYNTSDDLGKRTYLYDKENPEIIFTMGSTCVEVMFSPYIPSEGEARMYAVSRDLLEQFRNDNEVEDLRLASYFLKYQRVPSRMGVVKNQYRAYTVAGSDYLYNVQPTVFDAFLIRTVEVYLNKAEAQAMKGDLSGAITTLQPLLNTRYAWGKLPQIASLDEKNLVEFIRGERRRELCFEGHRWPDLKRYAVNTKYEKKISIKHSIYSASESSYVEGDYAGFYELKPYGEDEGWILPFPQSEITYNNGQLMNPQRPERINMGGKK